MIFASSVYGMFTSACFQIIYPNQPLESWLRCSGFLMDSTVEIGRNSRSHLKKYSTHSLKRQSHFDTYPNLLHIRKLVHISKKITTFSKFVLNHRCNPCSGPAIIVTLSLHYQRKLTKMSASRNQFLETVIYFEFTEISRIICTQKCS